MNILLVRTSALGDIIHCLPTLIAVRRALPEARIGWVIEEMWAPLLAGHPAIDQLLIVRTKHWRQVSLDMARDLKARIDALRAFGADVAIDLMGNHKGGLLARASGASRVIGAAPADRRERSSALWVGERVSTPQVHAVEQALGLLDALAIPPTEADFGGQQLLAEPPSGTAELLTEQARSGRPLVLIQAGAGWRNKMYPVDRWALVARGLLDAGYDVWLPSAPGEESLVEQLATATNDSASDDSASKTGCTSKAKVVDATDFRLAAALMRHSRLVLGGDTGPIHLAHALGTPVLCLIGPTDPRRNGPYDAPEMVLFDQLPCSYCYQRLDGPRACLLQLTPQRVLDRALEMLEPAGD